jgi:hypothetical protein
VNKQSFVRVLLRGGLGNQLFQYFSARELAQDISASLILDARLLPTVEKHCDGKASEFPEQISYFLHDGVVQNSETRPIPFDKLETWARVRFAQYGRALSRNQVATFGRVVHFSGNGALVEKPRLAEGFDAVLNHAFLNPTLFSYPKDQSVLGLNAIVKPTPWFVSMKEQILNHRPIAIHHRLGDHISLGNPASPDYIHRAFKHLVQLIGSDKVIVFSDEINKSKEILSKLPYKFEFIEPPKESPPIESLVLMASSRALVMSSSSFSWWAATLGSSLDLIPTINREWLNSPTTPEFFREIPDSWIQI